MARRLPVKSGQDVLKTFHRVREIFGLSIKRMGKGDHVIVHNRACRNFSVPLHKKLAKRTLLSVIADAGMTRNQFVKEDP